MQCKCGGEVSSNTHSVKTAKGLENWHDAPFEKSKAPYEVVQSTCKSCGRNGSIVVWDAQGKEVLPRWPLEYCLQPNLI